MRQKINGFIAVIVVVIILFSITMSDEILQTIRNTIDKNDVTEDKQSAKDNGSSNEMEIIEPASAQGMPEGIYLEILPRVELLSGVLSQTSWMDIRGPMGKGNKYFQDLKEFFAEYKYHDAVKIAEELTQNGFTYEAPVYFIVNLGPLPNLEHDGSYSDNLVKKAHRAGGEKILEEFRIALIDLAKKSNFRSFYEAHREDYKKYIEEVSKDFTPKKIIDWEREFFGWGGSEYHTVLAPALFPTGGYGAWVEKSNGDVHIYQIIRESGVSSERVYFNPARLNRLALHEWGHSFVNPSLEENWNLFKDDDYVFKKLFEPVQQKMKIQAYNIYTVFFYEQVLRAVEAIAYKDLYSESHYKAKIKGEEKNGFYLTEFTVKQLEYYRENRDKYKTFKDFVPYLFEQYYKNQEELLKLVND